MIKSAMDGKVFDHVKTRPCDGPTPFAGGAYDDSGNRSAYAPKTLQRTGTAKRRERPRLLRASISTQGGDCLAARVRIAATFTSRFLGLLPRGQLDMDEGLLLSPGGTVHTFGMRFPIDIVFLDASMQVQTYSKRVVPWRISLAPPDTTFVLELAAGRLDAVRLNAGEPLILHINTTRKSHNHQCYQDLPPDDNHQSSNETHT